MGPDFHSEAVEAAWHTDLVVSLSPWRCHWPITRGKEVCPSVCSSLSGYLSACRSVSHTRSVSQSVSQSVRQAGSQSVSQSVCLSVGLSVCLSLSLHPSHWEILSCLVPFPLSLRQSHLETIRKHTQPYDQRVSPVQRNQFLTNLIDWQELLFAAKQKNEGYRNRVKIELRTSTISEFTPSENLAAVMSLCP